MNNASTTETLVNAAKRLVDELPEGTSPPDAVIKHWLASARADDAARGVIWPTITPEQMAKAGLAWSIFPNMAILQGDHLCAVLPRASVRRRSAQVHLRVLCARALSRKAQEPKTEWVYAEPTAEKWGLVLSQDFSNMAAVQKGMQSRGFRGTLPNPHQERKVTNFHRNLAEYMGTGAPPRLIK